MSINWVMLASGLEGFVPLPKERCLWTSPPRTSIQIQSLNKYPGKEPFSRSSSSGRVHLTNQRIVYLPEQPTPAFQSFASPLLKLHDSRVTAPFFGPNAFVALAQVVLDGGIPLQHPAVQVKLTFKDGGAFDFHNNFIQITERLRQAADIAAESGQAATGSQSGGVDPDAVHLEQLPAYEESAKDARVVETPSGSGMRHRVGPVAASSGQPSQHPSEPPPGYDET